MIKYIIFFGAIGFCISFLMNRYILIFVKKKQFFFRADKRDINKGPRPRIGGISIYASYILTVVLVFIIMNSKVKSFFDFNLDLIFYLSISLTIIFMTGLIDDIRGLNAWQKLPFELIAALILFYKGIKIQTISIPLGQGKIILNDFTSIVFTVMWILLITNAINLIDGLDGLAGGISSLAFLSFIFISLINVKYNLLFLTFSLLGATVAFLFYNFYPSKIFLGDSGSLFLGFYLSIIAIKTTSKGSFSISIIVPILILFLPLFDTLLAFIRRIYNGKSPFAADSNHIHHKLLLKGYSEKKSFTVLMVFSTILSILGILSAFINKSLRIYLLIVLFFLTFILLLFLRYIRIKIREK